ncbi:LacI family DNA-binding transcriptional regulator [Calidifontibacter sp. DB0510]|uniref:LacI family DNA-binding transcriptional regulator n=1 Tax=Metallococcus carri TaxID=1656884 RepID=A0A967B024_9MICO|nr:LacI family DNA-binding transcriptional regulator [Metallococcus carri]NHN55582.1 LacI family DNA-binding transcriptional regulator [Metallococcus carri]NOP38234.1 LacI family DNA-binding transcriptional regulator [Calidifontibacter sp. DB2511S]
MHDEPPTTGARRARIADVARAAGVSATTVSHALSNSGRVSEQTRERILRAAEDLGYRPSPRATALRSGRSRTIAVASSMSAAVAGGAARQGFYLEVAAAAAERAFDYGYALVLVPPIPDELIETLGHLSVDGLLVVEPAQDDPIVRLARRDGVPFVSIGSFPGATDAEEQIDLQSDTAAELVIDHLVRAGVRRPALIVGDRPRTSYAAIEHAYRRAADDHGWPPVVERIFEADGEDGGRQAATRLLTADPQTDAIIAWVDAFAVGAVQAATALGRTPPAVRIVTRFDGPRARASEPAVTAVRLHLPEAATAGVDELLRLLGATTQPRAPIPRPELVFRASSPDHQQQA